MLSCVTIQNRKGINYPCLVGDLEGMSNKSEESKLMPKQTTGKKSKQGNNETNKSIENSNLSTEDTDRACKMVRRRTKQTRCFLRELHVFTIHAYCKVTPSLLSSFTCICQLCMNSCLNITVTVISF